MILKELVNLAGTYVAVKPVGGSIGLLAQWLQNFDVSNPIPVHKLHVTLLYSRKPVRVTCTGAEFYAVPDKWDVFENSDGSKSLVLLLDSPGLVRRHQELMALGATHDHPTYLPHLTISYDFKEKTPTDVPEVPFGLTFGNEYTEAIRE